MFCRKCGTENEEGTFCAQCGELLHEADAIGAPQRIPNYLIPAILTTVLCCLPFGIVAIIYAAQVNGKVQAGDIQGAMDSSSKAKMWTWLSFGIGLGVTLIYVVFMVIAMASGRLR